MHNKHFILHNVPQNKVLIIPKPPHFYPGRLLSTHSVPQPSYVKLMSTTFLSQISGKPYNFVGVIVS